MPELAARLGQDIPRLKSAQGTHWERLFSGRFDDGYFDSVRRIGLVHNRIELEPRWYIGGYSFVLSALTDLAVRTYRWRPHMAQAVIRIDETSQSAAQTNGVAKEVLGAATGLTDQSNMLNAEVRGFVRDLKAA